jgi:hypothetical protein
MPLEARWATFMDGALLHLTRPSPHMRGARGEGAINPTPSPAGRRMR